MTQREDRLEALRDRAERDTGKAGPPAETASRGYYGRPVIKAPVWTWEVPAYFFAGGVAGMSAVIAAAAALVGDAPAIARDARWIAAAGAAISPLLLIADLGRPSRFLNMLRVFKLRSPMSVGAWTLVVFSIAVISSLVLNAGAPGDLIAATGRIADGVAALAGLVLATYTGVLLGITTVPVWAKHFRLLPLHFGATSLGAAASLLELAGHRDASLNLVGLAAAAVVTAIAASIELAHRPVSQPLFTGVSGLVTRLGDVAAGPLALALRLAAPLWLPARAIAGACALAGSLLSRYGWIAAGRRSAQDPTWSLV